MQPFHEGHQFLLSKIFAENEEVIICIGSAQAIDAGSPKAGKNPLPRDERISRVENFIREQGWIKPYRIVPVEDIDSDDAWPAYLARCIGMDAQNENCIYFGDPLDAAYRRDLGNAGFDVVIVKRKKFKHRTPDQNWIEVDCASEIREIYRKHDFPI
jgi:cytidyltransferase-like protein